MNRGVVSERIELWSLDRFKGEKRRARSHPRAQIEQIANSIEAFGFTNPILVNPRGEIIVGYARYLAAKQANLTHVPVIVVAHLTDAEQRAYRIADNKLALNATWDEEVLKEELAALVKEAISLDLTGFTEEELRQLNSAPELNSGKTDEDEVPDAPKRPISVPGNTWLLDDHRLGCGDATQRSVVEAILGGAKASMVFTDPPYNVDYEGRGKRRILNDNLGKAFPTFLGDLCRIVVEESSGGIYICMSSSQLQALFKAFQEANGHFSTFIIWSKDHFTLGRSDYHRQFEPILYGWREGAERHWCGDRKQGDVWCFPKPRANRLHPTMKPVALVEKAILNSSRRGDTVLDPFAGAGSTLIACQKTGRRARLIELDPGYADVIVRRWQDFTGRHATLENSGLTFAEVAQSPTETGVLIK